MNINPPNQPRKDDVVLGDKNTPRNAAVLGGIQGVKARLNPAHPIEVKIAALKDALNYGEAGLDIVIKAWQKNPLIEIKLAAYQLLKERRENKIKSFLRHLPNCLNFPDYFDYDVVTINNQGLEISRQKHCAYGFTEDIGNGVPLEMVYIPGGTFLMGSPEDEFGRLEYESPQHQVTVKGFFMGKYPVTQTQWKAVASLKGVNSEINPDPSHFKGENRPVERVSWYEAVEWCDRVSQHTGKQYRLPSEAEWEYACRAGVSTAFHFGETITTELANYNGRAIYGESPEGIYRQQTTPVGNFGVANAFGLYDMHGNVWEWCADHWHSNYEGVHNDGSIWRSRDKYSKRVLRGGSWFLNPRYCRCAIRFNLAPGFRNNIYGFRVMCAAV
jgi:formylglycine-generating enzyme required for sulfatase activity